MAEDNRADARTDNQKIEMAKEFDEYEQEYRENHEVVHEDDEVVIIADHGLNEIDELASRHGANRHELRETFRALADQKMGEQEAHDVFSHADPIVFDKFEN